MDRIKLGILVFVAVSVATGSGVAFAAQEQVLTKMTGFTPDGTGAQIIITSTTGMTLDAQTATTLEQEVMDEFLKLHPGQSSVTLIGVDAEGQIEATALPYEIPTGGQTTEGTGAQPPTPPPPPPGTPDNVSRVDYHIIDYNGWNRDTSYSRSANPDPNGGGWIDGPWSDPTDSVYPTPGGGGGQCGHPGQPNCPKPF